MADERSEFRQTSHTLGDRNDADELVGSAFIRGFANGVWMGGSALGKTRIPSRANSRANGDDMSMTPASTVE